MSNPNGRPQPAEPDPPDPRTAELERVVERLRDEIEIRKRAEHALERRLEIEETLAYVSSRFVGLIDLDRSLDLALEAMGRSAEASRAYVFLLRDGGASMDNTHEWCADGVTPEIANLQGLDAAQFAWWLNQLRAGETIHEPDVAAMPDEAAAERELLLGQGIRSLLAMPLVTGDRLAGFVGFDRVGATGVWRRHDRMVLRVSADIIGNALERHRAEQARASASEHAELLRQAMRDLTSKLELPDVLDRLLSSLARLVRCDRATVLARDGDHVRVVGGMNLDGSEVAVGDRLPAVHPQLRRVLDDGEAVIVDQVDDDESLLPCHRGAGVCSWMALPMRVHDQVLGCLTVCSVEPFEYAGSIAFAQTFADEAALAIENTRLIAQIQRLATEDGLTGVYNRRQLFALGSREFARSRRYGNALSALMIDVDRFKSVNDTHGHAAGDAVLATVAGRCRDGLRGSDLVGRYGGDEFGVLLPEAGPDQAAHTAERLRARVGGTPVRWPDGTLTVTISVGIATLEPDDGSVERLFDRADRALLEAKRAGRDRTVAAPALSSRPPAEPGDS